MALHRPDYVRAPKIQKPSVARIIVRAIRNGDPPGRFIRKDEKSGKWVDIGDKKAAEKTSQALREKPNEELGTRVVGTVLPNPDSYLAGTITPAVTRNVAVVSGMVANTAEGIKVESDEKVEEKQDVDTMAV